MYFFQCLLCFALLLGISTGFNSSSNFFLTTTKHDIQLVTLSYFFNGTSPVDPTIEIKETKLPGFLNGTSYSDHTIKLQQTTLSSAFANETPIADPSLNVPDKKSYEMQAYMIIFSTVPLFGLSVIAGVCGHVKCKTRKKTEFYAEHGDYRTLSIGLLNEKIEYEHALLKPFIGYRKTATSDVDWEHHSSNKCNAELHFDTKFSNERIRLSRKNLLKPKQPSYLTSQTQTEDEKNDEDDKFVLLRTNDCEHKQSTKQVKYAYQELPQTSVDSFDLPIKEKTFNLNDVCKKVSMVKPLQSPGPEAAKTSENVIISQLDWNKIFSFLTTIIKPSELKLFMVHLVDGKDTSVDIIVDRIQNENSSSVERIYKCLKHWKQLMGNDADPQHIIKALEERGLNEDAYKFKEFMRNPPTVKSTVKIAVPSHSLCAPENVNLFSYMVTGASNNDSLFNQSTSTRYIAENPTTPIIEEPDDDPRLSRKNYMNDNSPASSDTNFKQSVNRKRNLPIDRLSRHGKRKCKILNKSNYELKQHFKTWRRRKSRKYLRAKIELQKQCIINLIKDPCCLQEVSYKTLMNYAIDCLMKYTNAPEDAIFSLKYTDYEKIQKTSHSENSELYLLHCANTGKFHVFGKDEYETLKLYVENARKRRIKELKNSVGKSFVEPEALFLNYKGEPIRTKNVQTNRHCFTSTPSSTSEENSDSNTSLSSTIYVEPESQSDWATCISSDQSYDDSAGSEVLLSSKLLNSMNDDAELTTTSAGQNIATQNISDNNDTASLNICTNVSGQERNSSSDSAGCVTEIKCANISNDRLQTNAEILSFCLQCIIEERRKLLNKTNRNVDDIELD